MQSLGYKRLTYFNEKCFKGIDYEKLCIKNHLDAWIITGGTNVGVMKYVGTAISDYDQAKRQGKKDNIVTIGVATWGTLLEEHRRELISSVMNKKVR